MAKNHWYNVVFVKGTSRRSYMIAAACIGNARSIGWVRLEDTEGATQGWDLVQTSTVAPAPSESEASECTPITIYRAEMTDLWGDGEGGWSGNYSWVRRATVIVPSSISDQAVTRRVKAALGIQGWRVDSWAANELCWRDGCVGAWAEAVS